MITTTLNRILECGPCGQRPGYDEELSGWLKLLDGLGKTSPDDKPLPYAEILRINGLNDALWSLQCEPQHHRVWRLLAVRIARRVQHLTRDPSSVVILDVAERHADGLATDAELDAAQAAARGMVRAARVAARDTVQAAPTGREIWAAWAVRAAMGHISSAALDTSVYAVCAAEVAGIAAHAAERDAQAKLFLEAAS